MIDPKNPDTMSKTYENGAVSAPVDVLEVLDELIAFGEAEGYDASDPAQADAIRIRAAVECKFKRLEELEKQAASMAEALEFIGNEINRNNYFDGGVKAMQNAAREALAAYHSVGLEEQTSSSATIGDTK